MTLIIPVIFEFDIPLTTEHRTQREVERRQAMMDQLATKEQQLDRAFKEGYQENTRYVPLDAESYSHPTVTLYGVIKSTIM